MKLKLAIEAAKVAIGLSTIIGSALNNRKRRELIRNIMEEFVKNNPTEPTIIQDDEVKLQAEPLDKHGIIFGWLVKLWFAENGNWRGGWQHTYYLRDKSVTD